MSFSTVKRVSNSVVKSSAVKPSSELPRNHLAENLPRYLDEKKVALLVGLSVHTLRAQRSQRKGIPYIKSNRSVRYNVDDIYAYMNDHKIVPAG